MTSTGVVVRGLARGDITAHYRWLLEQAGFGIADRFLDAVERAFATLVEHPRMGPTIGSATPGLTDIRKWKVDGYPNVVIFYEPRAGGISVVRVIHAAQDWWSLLDASD